MTKYDTLFERKRRLDKFSKTAPLKDWLLLHVTASRYGFLEGVSARSKVKNGRVAFKFRKTERRRDEITTKIDDDDDEKGRRGE